MANVCALLSFFTFDKGHTIVNLTETSSWYATAYQVAFFLGLCIFIYEGIRRKYPLNTWLLISASSAFLLIVGSKLGTFSISDWRLFFQEGVLVATGKKTSFGAALLIITSLWLVTKALRFKAPVWGAFAFFLPMVMLVQRVGCLLAGCCYGKPLESSGGVKYFGPSMIRDQQIHQHLITPAQDITQAVHNVPLYFMGVAFITIAFLLFIQKRIGNGKALFFVSILTMGSGRFLVEFFRDPLAHSLPQPVYYGLTPQQWLIGVLIIVFSILLQIELKKQQQQPIVPEVFPMRNLTLMLGLSIATLLLRDWFTNYEKVVVYSQLLVAGALNIKTIWETEHQLKPLWAPLSLFLMSTVVMAQEVPNDSIWIRPSKTYLNGSFTQNRLANPSYPCLQIESGCAGDYCALADSASAHGPVYRSVQVGFEHQFRSRRAHSYMAFGIDGAIERYHNNQLNRTFFYAHVSPYGKAYAKFGYISFGLRMGQLYLGQNIYNRGVYYVMPRLGFQVGKEGDLVNLKFGLLDDYLPNGIMPALFSTNLSLRLASSDRLLFRGGLSLGRPEIGSPESSIYYGLNFTFHDLKNDFMIVPTFGYTNNRHPTGEYVNYPQFALQVRYRLF